MLSHLLALVLLFAVYGCAGLASTRTVSAARPPMDSATIDADANLVALPELPAVRVAKHRGGGPVKQFVRFGQCQIEVLVNRLDDVGLWGAVDDALVAKLVDAVRACFRTASAESLDVVILPELALTVPAAMREELLSEADELALQTGMVLIAGSYYDDERHSRLVVVGPGWRELGYKVRPSRFEVSPRYGKGMAPGSQVLVVETEYGTFAVITCVDLISDEVNYIVRSLATRQEIDVLININHNPAAWEFMIEANSIVRRHPVFASVTNVYAENPPSRCVRPDSGYCYGHSAIFSSLRVRPGYKPNTFHALLDLLRLPVVTMDDDGSPDGRRLAYDTVAAHVPPFLERMLVYELNMRLKHVPSATNAPDQGYPPIRGVRIIELTRTK